MNTSSKPFPMDAIKKALVEFWDQQMNDDDEDEDSSFSLGPSLDSLTALHCLIILEKILGLDIKLPETLVQKGGYNTKVEFVNSLSKNTELFYAEHAK